MVDFDLLDFTHNNTDEKFKYVCYEQCNLPGREKWFHIKPAGSNYPTSCYHKNLSWNTARLGQDYCKKFQAQLPTEESMDFLERAGILMNQVNHEGKFI